MASGAVPTAVKGDASRAPQDAYIEAQLNRARRKVRMIELGVVLSVLAAVLLLYLFVCAIVDHWVWPLPTIARWLAFAVLVSGCGWAVWRYVAPLLLHSIHPLYAARVIERGAPSLKYGLMNFLFFRSQPANLPPAVYDVVRQSAAQGLSQVSIDATVDRTHLIRVMYLLTAVVATSAVYKVFSPKDPFQTAQRVILPWTDVTAPARVEIVAVEPGDATVIYGEQTRVSAMIRGIRAADRVVVAYSTADQQVVDRELAMEPVDGGARYEVLLPPEAEGLQQDLAYRVVAGDAVSAEYRLQQAAQPLIFIQRLEYEFPAYTQRPAQVVEGQGDIEALEGTRVTLLARANKPIRAAFIEWDPAADGTSATRLDLVCQGLEARGTFGLELTTDRKRPVHASYQVRFVTEDGRKNESPVIHRIAVLPDLPPVVDVLTPRRQKTEVREDGRQTIEVRAVDPDFGLRQLLLRGAASSGQPWEQVLLSDEAGWRGQAIHKHLLVPRELGLKSGDVLTFRAVAIDNRHDARGQPAPNEERTPEFQLVVTPPLDTAPRPDPQAAPPPAPTPDQPRDDQAEESGGQEQQPGQEREPKNASAPGPKPQSSPEQPAEKDPTDKQEGQADQQKSEPSEANPPQPQQPEESDEQPQEGSDESSSAEPAAGSQAGSQGAGTQKQQTAGQGQSDETAQEGDASSADQEAGEGETPPGGASRSPGTGDADRRPGQGSGSPTPPSEDLHDGDVFEIVRRHMEQQGPTRQQPGRGGSEPDRSPVAPPPGEATEGAKPQDRSAPPPMPGRGSPDNAPAGAGGTPSTARPAPSPGSPNPEFGDRPEGESGQPAETANETPRTENAPQGAAPPRDGGEDGMGPKDAAMKPAEKANDRDPPPPPDEPAPGAARPSAAGAGVDNNQPGAGDNGAANRDRPKLEEPDSRQPEETVEPPAISQSKRQSDSRAGKPGGDESGGGGQGGGQAAKLPGADSPGSQQAADEGAGAAQESGEGETSREPGNRQPSTGPGGQPADMPGRAGQQPGDDRPTPGGSGPPATPQTPPGQPPQPTGQGEGRREGQGGPPLGGGLPGDPGQPTLPPGQTVPLQEVEPDLEYTRNASDLVLDYLKNQQNQPDAQLLDRLGWSKEDMAEFVKRWESLKRSATASPEAQRELDESLRSLGLRPPQDALRRGTIADDRQRGNTDAGQRSAPPQKYLEQFNAFRKGASRARPEEAP